MTFLRSFGLFLACVVLLPLHIISAQTPPGAPASSAISDPIAETQLLQASAALSPSGSVPDTITASGTVAYSWGGKSVPGAVSLSWKAATGLVITSTTSGGIRVETTSWDVQTFSDEQKRTRSFSARTAMRSQFRLFPSIELSMFLAISGRYTRSLGTETLAEGLTDVVAVDQVLPANPQEHENTAVIFHLDHVTHLPIRRDDVIEAMPMGTGRIKRSLAYSDYRIVNGVLYPFIISETLNAQPTHSLTLGTLATQ